MEVGAAVPGFVLDREVFMDPGLGLRPNRDDKGLDDADFITQSS
jgi:hypothetical protein